LFFAYSKAYLIILSTPNLVNIDSWITTSLSVFSYSLPPILEYSPSLFSLIIIISISPAFIPSSGDFIPSKALQV